MTPARRKASTPYSRIYAAVKRIPRGKVATYGQIARLAGLGDHARQVGYALNAMPDGLDVPWHRVINAKGEVSQRSDPSFDWAGRQRRLLEAEGINFDARGRMSLKAHQWRPRRS